MNKHLKRTLLILGIVALVSIDSVLVYVYVLLAQYRRTGNVALKITGEYQNEAVLVNEDLTMTTYNIGFGAYSQDFTFFMDTGYDDEGKPTVGYNGKAKSKEDVEFNTEGAIKTIKDLNTDFVMVQEVDTSSTRSFYIDQDKRLIDEIGKYHHTHANNFHTSFLPYPFYDMHGAVQSGLSTFSKYKILEAKRMQYTIADNLTKFFDLDRCFSTQKIKVNDGSENEKYLYIINSHMSAYDESGKVRASQVSELSSYLYSIYEKGDYFVVGGDFNHDLLTFNPNFNYNNTNNRPFGMSKKDPDWVSQFFNEEGKSLIDIWTEEKASKTGTNILSDWYRLAVSDNGIPTCRNNDIEWEPDNTYVCLIDGFLVSKNISVSEVEVIPTNNGNKGYDWFAYSDHQPVKLTFKLEK